MHWLFFAFITAVGFSSYNIAGKLTAGKISPIVGVSVFHLSSGFILLCIILGSSLLASQKFMVTKEGVGYAVLGGLSIMVATTSLLMAFQKGAEVSQIIPVIYVGTFFLTFILSAIFLNETISTDKIIGVGLACASIYMFTRNV